MKEALHDFEVLQSMMDKADKHNLKLECLITLINNISGDISGQPLDLEQECSNDLVEWDV